MGVESEEREHPCSVGRWVSSCQLSNANLKSKWRSLIFCLIRHGDDEVSEKLFMKKGGGGWTDTGVAVYYNSL